MMQKRIEVGYKIGETYLKNATISLKKSKAAWKNGDKYFIHYLDDAIKNLRNLKEFSER